MAHRRVARRTARAFEARSTVAAPGGLGIERVLDGVLEELGQRHGERGRHVRRHLTEVPMDGDHDGLGGNHRVLGHLHE